MRVKRLSLAAGPEGVQQPGAIVEMDPDAALLATLNRTAELTLAPLTRPIIPSDDGKERKAPAIKNKALQALYALTAEHDKLAAKIDKLEAVDAQELDSAELGSGEVMRLAQEQAKREIEARSLRLVLASIERRFMEQAAKFVEEERQRRRAELDKLQPELDTLAAEIDQAIVKLVAKLRRYLDQADRIRNEVGMTPALAWPMALAESLENRHEVFERERAARAEAAG